MKFIKKFDELDILKESNQNLSKKKLGENYFSKYPKNETKIYFTDRESTYELSFFNVKFVDNGFILQFKAENGSVIDMLKEPPYLKDEDMGKISLLPVQIKPESKELLNSMYNENNEN